MVKLFLYVVFKTSVVSVVSDKITFNIVSKISVVSGEICFYVVSKTSLARVSLVKFFLCSL